MLNYLHIEKLDLIEKSEALKLTDSATSKHVIFHVS